AALTSERLERGRRRAAQIARLGNEDRSVALERRRVELVAVERAVTAVDDVELEPSLGERLREREELLVRLGPAKDRSLRVQDRELVHGGRLLVEVPMRLDERDGGLQRLGCGGLPAGLFVDPRPPVVPPPAAVRVGLQEHQLV